GEPLDRARRLADMADAAIDLVVSRGAAARAAGDGVRRRGDAFASDDDRAVRRLIRQRAGNAGRARTGLLLLAELLAAEHGALRIVRLVRALDLGEVDLRRDLRAHAFLADERSQDVVHAPAERLLDLARVLEALHRRERTILARAAQEPPALVHDGHALRLEIGHARCDEMHDPGDALLVERAPRMQIQEHRRARLAALAHEHRFARQREMDPRGLDAVERHDRARR